MKTILFYLLSCLALCAQDYRYTFRSSAFMGNLTAAAAPSCTTLLAGPPGGTIDGDSSAFANSDARRYVWFYFTNTQDKVICKAEVALKKAGTPNFNISIGIYKTSDNTNVLAQVGGDSDSISSTTLTTSFTTNTFTWSANLPSIGASNHMFVIKCAGFGGAGDNIITTLYNPVLLQQVHFGDVSFVDNSLYNRRPIYFIYCQ